MSYDLRVAVKIDNTDKYITVGTPEFSNPTYNLSEMFRACTSWNYTQGEYYSAEEFLPRINRGIEELTYNSEKYKKYESPNGWGTVKSALEALESWANCIEICSAELDISLEHLYICW